MLDVLLAKIMLRLLDFLLHLVLVQLAISDESDRVPFLHLHECILQLLIVGLVLQGINRLTGKSVEQVIIT
jgi:hypothetical protein